MNSVQYIIQVSEYIVYTCTLWCLPELCVVLAGHLLLVGKVTDDEAGQVGHHGHRSLKPTARSVID